MENDGKHNQTEVGDPFSVFAELEVIRQESRQGLHLFQSKLNELLLELTMTKGRGGGINETEKKLIKETMEIYANNIERRQRGYTLINAVREARNRQD